jgi:hypothetical protein
MARAHEGWLRELMSDVDDKTLAQILAQLGTVKRSASSRLLESGD